MEHTIGSRIKKLRRAQGLTASELARRTGITENAVRKLEAGDSAEPRFTTGLRIARELGVTPDAIASPSARRSVSAAGADLAMVIRQIRQCRNALVHEGVEHIAVFGSVARGEASSKSDVDVVVDPSPSFTLFNLAGVREILERVLARPADAVTRKTIEAGPFAETVAAEAVRVF
jgi:hypothetical protein